MVTSIDVDELFRITIGLGFHGPIRDLNDPE